MSISPAADPAAPPAESDALSAEPMPPQVFVRYGRIPEVARFTTQQPLRRGDRVVVQTHRGPLLGDVLGDVPPQREPDAEPPPPSGAVLRVARPDDVPPVSATEFADWCGRIAEWEVDVELLDVERSLDGEKTTLYVLNGRDAAPTKLALQAAAAGLGLIDVQPVTWEGVAPPEAPSGGGCGSCGHH